MALDWRFLGVKKVDDLENIITRVRALKKADEQYNNFSGLEKGKTGSVRFIVETDEIKK